MSSDHGSARRGPRETPGGPSRDPQKLVEDMDTRDLEGKELDALLHESRTRASISDHQTPPASDKELEDLVAMSRRTGTYVAPTVPAELFEAARASEDAAREPAPAPAAPVAEVPPPAVQAPVANADAAVARPAPRPRPKRARWALAGLGVMGLAALFVWILRTTNHAVAPSVPAESSASPTHEPAAASTPPPSTARAPAPTTEPAPTATLAAETAHAGAEPPPELAAARAALERFREGMRACVRATRTLPGSSNAVPANLVQAASGYASTPEDWRTAVWACARFHLDEPMHFQLQWRLLRPGDGLAIAVFGDADGRAAHALAFHSKLPWKGVIESGAIEPIDPTTVELSTDR